MGVGARLKRPSEEGLLDSDSRRVEQGIQVHLQKKCDYKYCTLYKDAPAAANLCTVQRRLGILHLLRNFWLDRADRIMWALTQPANGPVY